MTTTISSTLEEIKKRFVDLKLELDKEKTLNANLQEQINGLNSEQVRKDEQISSMKDSLTQVENALRALELEKQQQINAQSTDKDQQIDFLVKEIDQCINQIKTNL